jgi:sugar-specific transcriptional regulator TrmB
LSSTEITEVLVSFGLSPLQSACYATLVKEGKLPAAVIAQIIGIDRSDVYRVLRALQKLGLVEVELGDKSYYYAVSPEKAVSSLLSLKQSELLELKEKSKVLCELLENSRISKTLQKIPETGPFFRLVSGPQVFTRWGEAMMNARLSVMKVIPGYTVPVHYLKLSDIESEVSKRVPVQIITEVTAQNLQTVKRYYEKVRIFHADGLTKSFRYLIVDDKEVFMGGTPITSSIEDHIVIWTNNNVFVDACLRDFQDLLKKAVDARSFSSSLNEYKILR